jgi:hypothetical protein
MGLDCEWCRHWRRERDFITKARLALENKADLEVDLGRKWAIMQGIKSAEGLLEELERTIRLHEFRSHPAVDGWP